MGKDQWFVVFRAPVALPGKRVPAVGLIGLDPVAGVVTHRSEHDTESGLREVESGISYAIASCLMAENGLSLGCCRERFPPSVADNKTLPPKKQSADVEGFPLLHPPIRGSGDWRFRRAG
jgi:hypothetical protein